MDSQNIPSKPRRSFSDLNLKSVHVISRKDFDKMVSECKGIEWFKKEVGTIQDRLRPNFECSVGSRTFGLYVDGEFLLKFLDCQDTMICKDKNDPGIQEVKNLAGIILEIGSNDLPMVFKDNLDMGRAWRKICRMSGTHLTDEEMDLLGVDDWDEGGADKSDC
jgi:hypothetical protein